MQYQICTKCLMDTTDPNIRFYGFGICSWCKEAAIRLPHYQVNPEQSKHLLEKIVTRIKKDAFGEYDSILGVSGGVDSSYTAYLAKELGLKPLLVHFDNGWNSEVAVANIKKIVDYTGFDFFTYVIHWREFRDLQRAFFKAGVIDIEILTDHAINASLFFIRRKHGIKYVLSGTNYSTEHGLPKTWVWNKLDLRNIKAIHKRFGEEKLKSFPTVNTLRWILIRQFGLGGIYIELLNHIHYKKLEAMKTLREKVGWRYYGGKHYESTFTKFYQSYVLPRKFGIDKRRAHISALIRNGEMSREEGLKELAEPLYNPQELINDTEYVLKKLGFTSLEFESMMNTSPRKHSDFPSEQWLYNSILKLRPLKLMLQRKAN